MSFKVGDSVVYPSQGAGVVSEKTTRNILGQTHEYLKISFIRGDMEVLVPLKKGQEVGLRHTVTEAEVAQLFDAMRKADLPLPTQWPPRYRAEQDILSGGDAYALARLVGVLSKRDFDKGLAATEREVLEAARAMLASELAVVQSIEFDQALRSINEAVREIIG